MFKSGLKLCHEFYSHHKIIFLKKNAQQQKKNEILTL